jgi:hypothetical protein
MASGDTLCIFTARDGVPTATDGATHGILAGAASPAEGVPTLAFDSAADPGECADFVGILPRAYAGGGLTLYLHWASGVTTGATVWNAAFRRIDDDGEDINTTAHSYDFNAVTATTATVAGEVDYAAITFTDGADMNSLAVGELFNLRIRRNGVSGSDDMAGDALLIAIEIKET